MVRTQRSCWLQAVALATCALLLSDRIVAQSVTAGDRVRPATARITSVSGFVANEGQWPEEVRFYASEAGVGATLLRDAIVLAPLHDPESDGPRSAPLVLRFAGGASALGGADPLPTKHHFFVGDASQHRSNVPGFDTVTYSAVAPGIDVLVRREDTGFAYDLHVAPGADLAALELRFEGATGAHVRDDGVLVFDTEHGPVEQHIGASWEIDAATGERIDVVSGFRLLEGESGLTRIGFAAPGRDPTRAFVLDPSLIFSTYIGGSTQDRLREMDVGPDGSTYLTATAIDLPTTPNALDRIVEGVEGWVGKLSPDGSTLEWATFLGGNNTERPIGIHRDEDGSLVVVGLTWSADFPTTPGSLQPVTGSPDKSDLFVSRITPDGSSLIWSTFYGGAGFEEFHTSALLPSGDVIAAGAVDSLTLPATLGAYDTQWNLDDWALLRISADGSSLVFQSFFAPGVSSLAVDAASDIYIGGAWIPSWGSIATPGAFQEQPVGGSEVPEGVVIKMDSMGSEVLWATHLGGSGLDNVQNIAIDAASAIYVVGATFSEDFPATEGAFDQVLSDQLAFYVAKLLPSGSDLVWATFLESPDSAQAVWDLAVDRAGNVVVVGSTNGSNFPTTADAFQPEHVNAGPSGDATLTKFDAFGESLEYSTYFGGSDDDTLVQLGLDAASQIHMGCLAYSADLFTTPDSYDPTYNEGGDISVTAWDLGLLPWTVLGSGLKGTSDIPNLAGTGVLTPGWPTRLSVRGALPLTNAWFAVGLTAINASFKGGTFVPAPTVLAPFTPDAGGAHDRSFPWLDVPAGIDFYIQAWVQDPGGIRGWAATNALQFVSQ